jgi:hypothetical protein
VVAVAADRRSGAAFLIYFFVRAPAEQLDVAEYHYLTPFYPRISTGVPEASHFWPQICRRLWLSMALTPLFLLFR